MSSKADLAHEKPDVVDEHQPVRACAYTRANGFIANLRTLLRLQTVKKVRLAVEAVTVLVRACAYPRSRRECERLSDCVQDKKDGESPLAAAGDASNDEDTSAEESPKEDDGDAKDEVRAALSLSLSTKGTSRLTKRWAISTSRASSRRMRPRALQWRRRR